MTKILITSALLYANGPLHFGHLAGAYLPADCYARFQRMRGHEVLYICGSDEYGMAITLSAELAGHTPREHVDYFHELNKSLFARLSFSFDHYSRTTCDGHAELTQAFFRDLLVAGYIEERVTDQLYAEADDKFLADRYVVGTCPKCGFEKARGDECSSCGASYDATDLLSPRSRLTGAPLTQRPTRHWFLRLDLFKERLREWLGHKDWKGNVLKFAQGYVDELHPRAITRDSSWGIPIPLPNTEGKVLYVWFDAPIGYISATKEWARLKGEPEAWKRYWCDEETKLVHFIGKDNIPFHAVIFPAMIMGQSQPYKLVDELPANEFFHLEGRQFSKSDGWYIDLEDFLTRYSADQLRYALAANAPETSDSEFSWGDFQQRCNGDLLGKYGNLANRVLLFWQRHYASKEKIPEATMDPSLQEQIRQLADSIATAFEGFQLRRACQMIMELAQRGNVYFNEHRPWQAAKEGDEATVDRVLYSSLELLKTLAIVSSPILPETAQKLWEMVGGEGEVARSFWQQAIDTPLPQGRRLSPPSLLFTKIEETQIEEERSRLGVKP